MRHIRMNKKYMAIQGNAEFHRPEETWKQSNNRNLSLV